MDKNHVVRIQCTDQKGLIASISGILFQHNHNVLVMKEFVEQSTNTFFARLELTGNLNAELLSNRFRSVLPDGAEVTIIPRRKKKLILFVTREHHCLSDLLVRHHFDELHASIQAVIGNHGDLSPFTERMGIPFFHIPHDDDKTSFEKRMLEILSRFEPDYLVLAKFMRILSPHFVSRYRNRILNIHHSFLPAFKGANPYKRAFERGVKIIGATAHLVNDDLDEGPIIVQKTIEIDHEHELRDMIEAGHEIEKAVLAEALKKIVEDKVFVSGNKTIVLG